MPRLHALELLPDAAGQEAVRRSWLALRHAGLPSQLDHPGDTNAPHVTVLSAPVLDPAVTDLAVALLGPLLPLTVRASGLLVLGTTRVSLARSVDLPDAVVAAVLELRAATPERQHLGWLPHVSLARRVPRAEVARALEVLEHDDLELTLVELRRWDPDENAVTTLAPPPGPVPSGRAHQPAAP